METPKWLSYSFGGHRRHGGGEGKSRPCQERESRTLSTSGGLQDEEADDRGTSRQSGRFAQHP